MTELRDKLGHSIGQLEWATLYNDIDYRRVQFEMIGDIRISTMWMGVSSEWLFETMTFCEPKYPRPQWNNLCYRYDTECAAILGHFIVCVAVRSESRQLLPAPTFPFYDPTSVSGWPKSWEQQVGYPNSQMKGKGNADAER